MPKYGYLVVEGVQDATFVQRLLGVRGFSLVQSIKELDPYWHPLVPTKFPYKDDLLRRVPVPLFMRSETSDVQIAIHVAGGETAITVAVEESLARLPPSSLSAIGAVLDADSTHIPAVRAQRLAEEFRKRRIEFASLPGVVTENVPATGIFVMPDNSSQGTLETLLIECAAVEYPEGLAEARTFIESVDRWNLSADDSKEFRKKAGPDKALVGSIASVLRPGRAIQVSIQDNQWLGSKTITLPAVQNLMGFLEKLFSLPISMASPQ